MTCVFAVRAGEFQICIAGEVLPHFWSCRGAALAGLQVELRRRAARAL